ncbi:gliding motility-associated C-terminal domain-containing protein [Fluviicola sp.]|uniref:T9SS type B sorting domain-containing protein n=1 Tax=Fluviicola sp. TaxID=1917219 RepID=UPI0031E091C2
MRLFGVLVSFFIVFSSRSYSQQLIINEVSQGTGSAEYVELLVIGTPSCQTPTPCMDLRGIVLDDNNGYFAAGSGTGIAQGAIRFANNTFWSCIPQGTMIVIYNESDRNSAIPPDDLSMTDGNCRLIIPVSSTLFEGQSTSPTSSNSSYPANASWFAGAGSWNQVAMANSGDSFLILSSITASTPSHAVSYGNNSNNTIIYFSGGASGKVFSMTNNTNNNPSLQANWTSGNVGTDETPGAANNSANSAWIASMNPQCGIANVLQATATSTPTGCGSTCTGTATVTASGGTAPYTYSWSGSSATTATLTGLCAGTYTVTVTDAGGCSITAQTTVTNSSSTIAVTVSATNETCQNACNGSVTATATGGTTPYTYSWTNTTATTATVSNVCPNTYVVTVTDQNGCSATAQAVVGSNPGVSVTATAVNETCQGVCDGSVSTTVSGGSAPYSYSWSVPATTANITNRCPGTYSVTVTDQNGCTGTAQATISSGTGISVTASAVNETCQGACDGSVSSTVSGGSAPYSYSWSVPATTATITNQCPGTYSVTVTDQNGCTGTASGTVSAGTTMQDPTIQTTGPFSTSDAPVQFIAASNGGTWAADCGACITSAGVFNPQTAGAGTYQICYSVGAGACASQDCQTIVVTGCTPQTTNESHSICPGSSYTFNGQTFTTAGSYPFQFTGQNGCDSTHILNLSFYPVTPTSQDITRCEGDSVNVQGTWYYVSDNVVVNIVDQNGCPTTHTTHIVFEDCSVEDYAVYIPNIFTPNNDNINDFFAISITGGFLEEGFIVNRWGNLIKEFYHDELTWDGKTKEGFMVPDGVYTYVLVVSNSVGTKTKYNGFVTVVR